MPQAASRCILTMKASVLYLRADHVGFVANTVARPLVIQRKLHIFQSTGVRTIGPFEAA
jgi:hypothetical protein